MQRQLGLSLLESLICLALLSFAVLGLFGLQARMLASATDAQQRVIAAGLVDRLLSYALVDPANAHCYVRPAPTTPPCVSSVAIAAVAQWEADVAQLSEGLGTSELMTVPAGGSYIGANRQLSAQVQWRGKSGVEMHNVKAVTDVR
jgi:type IV pilus assembly protein PilV